MEETHVAVIGAGPHGLAAAAHLGRAGVECHVLGDPMSFWSTMPAGMLLRSNATATGIAEHDGPLALDGFRARTGRIVPVPVPLEDFIDYGRWVQRRVAPDVDNRRVDGLQRSGDGFVLRLHDGTAVRARRVVVATGIADFVHLPAVARGLPTELVSHTSQHRDLGVFGGRSVLVVGLGQSALESAALMREHDADVEVVGRRDHINWLHGGKYHRRLGRAAPLFYAPDRRRPARALAGRRRPELLPAAAPLGAGPAGLPSHPAGGRRLARSAAGGAADHPGPATWSRSARRATGSPWGWTTARPGPSTTSCSAPATAWT